MTAGGHGPRLHSVVTTSKLWITHYYKIMDNSTASNKWINKTPVVYKIIFKILATIVLVVLNDSIPISSISGHSDGFCVPAIFSLAELRLHITETCAKVHYFNILVTKAFYQSNTIIFILLIAITEKMNRDSTPRC